MQELESIFKENSAYWYFLRRAHIFSKEVITYIQTERVIVSCGNWNVSLSKLTLLADGLFSNEP